MENKSEKEAREVSPERTNQEIVENLYEEQREIVERKEALTEKERMMRKELEQEVDALKMDPALEKEAEIRSEQIDVLDGKGKIKKLLDLAEEKGLFFSVKVAKDMKDPYILDVFHDLLAKEGLYKKFDKFK